MPRTAKPQTRAAACDKAVIAAYRKLAKRAGNWVSLADIRDQVQNPPFAHVEVDAALLRLARSPHVHIAPDPDQKSLTARDHEAALLIGGKRKHLLAITK